MNHRPTLHRLNHTTRVMTLVLALVLSLTALPGAPQRAARAAGAPTARLSWSMTRFTGYLVDPNDLLTARNHINPPEGYRVFLDGCASTAADGTYLTTYKYTVTGGSLTEPIVKTKTVSLDDEGFSIQRDNDDLDPDQGGDGGGTSTNQCSGVNVSVNLPLGSYSVTLTVTDNANASHQTTQAVVVKDFLIISLGDSYASGEGAPDEAQGLIADLPGFGIVDPDRPVRWSDVRCHRSAKAAAAQAARQLELNDPHTSVTFISLACSGATINRPTEKENDPNRPQGSGLLSGYSGVVWDGPWTEETRLPPQVDQMRKIVMDDAGVQKRPIDALLISGGGNDSYFADIVVECVWHNVPGLECHNQDKVKKWVSSELVNTDENGLTSLERRYDLLHDAVHANNFQVRNVFVTEYPDPTRNENGEWCGLWPTADPLLFNLSNREMEWASQNVVRRLNENIHRIGARYAADGWHSVDGISEAFFGDPANGKPGHGYCASDKWMNTSLDGIVTQGPLGIPFPVSIVAGGIVPVLGLLGAILGLNDLKSTTGTMHPNYGGQAAIKNEIVRTMTPVLYYDPTNPVPSFTASVPQTPGADGWLTGPATLTVEAKDADGIRQPRISINEQLGCVATGVSCTQGNIDPQTYRWTVDVAEEGVYRLQFAAQDGGSRLASFAQELKLDLNDPTADVRLASGESIGDQWYTGPVVLTLGGGDTPEGSGLAYVEYSVDNGPAEQAPGGGSVTISGDGAHTLTAYAVDVAGRRSQPWTATIKIDATAPVSSAQTSPVANGAGWNRADVEVILSASDGPGSGVKTLEYSATGAQVMASTTVPGATVRIPITAEGATTITYAAVDNVGHVEAERTMTVKLDKGVPQVQCATTDGVWHATDVSLACAASDTVSGLADTADTGFSLVTAVPEGTETSDAATGSRNVCDVADNCTTAGPIAGNKVDKKAPSIALTTSAGEPYLLNQAVTATYGCSDGGSGVQTCDGTLPSGSNLHTASVGTKGFVVNTSDQVGNAGTQSTTYRVTYNICTLYDQTKARKAGSVAPIKLQLCDVQRTNVSAADLVVTATGLTAMDSTASTSVEDGGNANPDSNFRFDETLGGYVFNLSTDGLSTGTWQLSFTVAGDPVPHTVTFDVR